MGAEISSELAEGEEPPTSRLQSMDLKGVAQFINSDQCKNIVVMTGAGISVAAGIPDFRSPGTGLYDNLQKYNLPEPTAVFELDYFKTNPKPFCLLAKELYPGNFNPTKAHYFIRLLHEKGKLLRNFSQNVDTLERLAGIPPEKLVEAHGCFAKAHCIDCKAEYSQEFVKEIIFKDEVPHCTEESCKGLVKPDIVFFGEGLPKRFFELQAQDMPKCDLLIIMGTSLAVYPFAGTARKVNKHCVRLLINRELVGSGFRFTNPVNWRDVHELGDIQDLVDQFVKELGWENDFNKMLSENPVADPSADLAKKTEEQTPPNSNADETDSNKESNEDTTCKSDEQEQSTTTTTKEEEDSLVPQSTTAQPETIDSVPETTETTVTTETAADATSNDVKVE